MEIRIEVSLRDLETAIMWLQFSERSDPEWDPRTSARELLSSAFRAKADEAIMDMRAELAEAGILEPKDLDAAVRDLLHLPAPRTSQTKSRNPRPPRAKSPG